MNLFESALNRHLLIITAILAAAFAACSVKPSPMETVKAYEKAVNSHNVEKVMKYYDDNIVFRIVGQLDVSGLDELRGVSEYDSVLNTNLTIGRIRAIGDSVTCNITEKNKWMSTVGIDSAFFPNVVFVAKDGKISSITAEMAKSAAGKFIKVLDSFLPWLRKNHPEKMMLMMPEGAFVHNAGNGETILAMLAEWRKSSAGANLKIN